MEVRVLDSAMIVDFIGEGFDSTEICSIVKSETEIFSKSIKDQKLIDWETCFRFVYNNVRQILIYTKEKSYSKEKITEIRLEIQNLTKIHKEFTNKRKYLLSQENQPHINENKKYDLFSSQVSKKG